MEKSQNTVGDNLSCYRVSPQTPARHCCSFAALYKAAEGGEFTRRKTGYLLLYFLIILFTSCGGHAIDGVQGDASLAIKISNSKTPQLDKNKYAQVKKYVVKVETTTAEKPVIVEFDGRAESGVIENVPIGDDNKVYVDAVNSSGQVIRQGENFDVDIGAGENSVIVNLESVPIFINIKNGSIVENSRLMFRIFADAGHFLALQDKSAPDGLLADLNTITNQISYDVSTSLGLFRPPLLSAGKHNFTVRDLNTNRMSSVEVMLIDGGKRMPAPFVSAISVGMKNVSKIFN